MIHLETHGREFIDNSLSAVCLALGQIASCSYIIDVIGLSYLQCSELSARTLAQLLYLAEVAPLWRTTEIGLGTLNGGQCCSFEFNILEYVCSHHYYVRTERLCGECFKSCTTSKSLVADGSNADRQIHRGKGCTVTERTCFYGFQVGGQNHIS